MANKAGMATGVTVARINVKVSPDTKLFRSELQDELNDIERTMKGRIEIKADLDSAQARADFRRLISQMQKNGKVNVGVSTVPTGGAGGGGGGKGGKGGAGGGGDDDSGGIFSKLSKIKPPNFGSGINPAGYAVILAGILAVAGPLLGIITTALLTIPGLIALVATPIAALTLGIDGFKKAAETLAEPFKELKDVMSAKVQEQFTPVFESLRSVFPMLQASLPSVTQGLADMFQGVADAVTAPQNMTMIEETIRGIGASLSAAKPGIQDFTSGLIELARDFTVDALPGIVEWFNGAGADFKDWVSGLDLKTAFSGLGNVLTVVLDLLGRLAKVGMEWIQDPSKVNDFTDGLSDLATALGDIAELSSTLKDVFKNMIPSVNWEGIKEDLTAPFTSKDAPWRKFDPAQGMQTGGIVSPFPVDRGAKAQVDDVNASLRETEAAAAAAKAGIDKVTAGAPPAGLVGGGGEFGAAPTAKVEVPDTAAAEAKISEYQSFVDSVTQQVRGSLSEATSGESLPAPDFSSFKSAWQELPGVVTTAGAEIQTAAEAVAQNAKVPFQNLGAELVPVGQQMMAGLAAGITAGGSTVISAAVGVAKSALAEAKSALGIKSPSREFMKVGDYAMQGMAVGMENGIQPVIDQARGLASKVSDAFASGMDPTDALKGYGKKEIDAMQTAVGYQSKLLGLQIKGLDLQARRAGKGGVADGLKAQADALRSQKDEVDLQDAQIAFAQEYQELKNPKKGKSGNVFLDAINELMTVPNGFASATADQAMQDLNISGDGALQSLLGYGMDFAKQGITNVFNTSNVDDTLSLQFAQTSRQAQGVSGR